MKDIAIGKIKAFEITGLLYNSNKRFKKIITCGSNGRTAYQQAMMTNIWKGTVWARLDSGNRVRLKTVYN